MDSTVNKARVITGHCHIDAGRQCVFQIGDCCPNTFRNIKRVRLRLTHDAKTNGCLAVRPDSRTFNIWTQCYRRNIADLRAPFNIDTFEVFWPFKIGRGTNHNRLIGTTQRTRWRIKTHGRKCAGNIRDGQPVACQARLIDIDTENLVAITIDLHIGDTGNSRENILDLIFNQHRHIVDRHGVGRYSEAHDRIGIGIGLDDARRISFLRHIVCHT